MTDAVKDTSGLDAPTGVTATVACGGTNGDCTPCDPPAAEDTDPQPCATETSTGWDVVTLSATLHGTKKTVEAKTSGGDQNPDAAEFQLGLAGVAVRSNQKITTTTQWTLPVTLRLTRGVGPQVVINPGDKLENDVTASLPSGGIDAVVGYLPAHVDPTGAGQTPG